MRRNNLAILILLIGGFGCRETAHERVYVDFEAVLASYGSSSLPSRLVPKPPPGLPARTVSIPAVPSRTVVVQGAPTVKAQSLLDKNRKDAIEELGKLLSQRYLREAERAGQQRIRALDPAKQAAYNKAQQEARAEFQTYADQRGYLVAQLTSLVGFPDPNPTSLPPPTAVPAFVQQRLAQAVDFRKKIADLDASYTNRVNDLLAQAGKEYNVSLAFEQAQINEDRQDAIARASNEAMSEAAKSYKELSPLIMGATTVDLPGEPAQSATLPAVPSPIAAPPVRERTLTPDQRRAILKSQLDMWIALNGYELSSTPDGVADKTADFVKWRQEKKL